MHSFPLPTSHGLFLARYTDQGLAQLHFPGSAQESAAPSSPTATLADWHSLTSAAVISILSGQVPNLLPPLDLSSHTPFQRSVWHQLRGIPFGVTLSYSQVAQRLGKPSATRAVGGACGANPIPLIIPCHRVLAAGQALGGFSGGLHWKRKLLAIEGITIKSTSRTSNPQTEQPELFTATETHSILSNSSL